MKHSVYVSYQEAQKLIPIFEYYGRHGPLKEVRQDARNILKELRWVRDVDYDPLRGMQLFLKDTEYEFFDDVLNEVSEQA